MKTRPIIAMSLTLALVVPCLVTTGCDPAGDAPATAARQGPVASPSAAQDGAAITRPRRKLGAAPKAPPRVVPRARQTFEQVMRLIDDKYVEAGLSRDELWSGAIDGMLQRLIQAKGRQVNTLLSPDQLREMKVGLAGSLSGVGVVIKVVEQMVLVMQLLPGSPATRAGLKPGDRILAVDGTELRGLSLTQIVKLIRGPTGSTVKLYVQRQTREWTLPVVRGKLTVQGVTNRLLGHGVALVRVTSFNRQTVSQLDTQLAALSARGARRVVLDLRACPGGLLEVAIQVADRFLAPGAAIVSMRGRAGAAKIRRAKGDHPWDRWPVVVLTSSSTASGAEIVAAALADNGRATLVGQPTLGKGTVETVVSLNNGWALKLSTARFFAPKGRSLQGQGLKPHFLISGPDDAARSYLPCARMDPDQDPQIQAALRLLRDK